MARFEREAQLLASLNHPNIAALYGLEESDAVRALVIELVEGLSLAERIAAGPMPLDEALPIARQIAEALEYAHDQGIIHRDLKPANVKITRAGTVKLLDFGLAKALDEDLRPGDASNSPTLSMAATRAGVILGTAAYMPPEQAKGKPADRRADIWAFGVVLYEMLTGRQLYSGESAAETLASVMKDEPRWDRLPAETPEAIRRLLRRCLEKDVKRRLQAIGEARIATEEALSGDRTEAAPIAAAAPARRGIPWLWAAVTAVLAMGLAITGALLWRATRPTEQPLTRLSVDLGPEAMTGLDITAAISPDGRRLVFPARGPDGQQLATRLLDQAQATLLPGTESAIDPFFSPDGQWVGFFARGALKKISVQGGAPVTLCNASTPEGGSWGEDGNIVAELNQGSGLVRVPAAGGTPQLLTKLVGDETTHRWPQVLPGGQGVLFTASPTLVSYENASIEVMSFKSGQVKTLLRGGYLGRYVPSGHLVYIHQGVLYGVAFDPARLEVQGTPTPLLEDIAANPVTGGGQFDFSGASAGSGTFVYLAGKGAGQTWQVSWLDSAGKIQPLIAIPGAYVTLRLSPDGRRLGFVGSAGDLYIYNLDRETTTRLTFTGGAITPVWTPDGKHIVYRSISAAPTLWWIRTDGAGQAQRLLGSQGNAVPWSFSPDGRRLAYFTAGPETGLDLWMLPVDASDPEHPKPGKPELFLRTPADENVPRFSPDGHWIAYRSNESGINEIYVRPFPGGAGGKWQVSTGGGLYGIWSNNGRELFYET
ncbi:MAG TPA: protein kinase, partial [Bryobacterales bacterium]|nr:protein kinase [Bryobacterales bacterium]